MTTAVGRRADLQGRQHVEAMAARLSRRYTGLGEAAVRDAVAAAFDRYAEARIRLFVPILAERSARVACDRLEARRRGGEPGASGGV